MTDAPQKIRADKWLFHARFFKTRALAARMIAAGHFRVDSRKALKPSKNISPGQILTFVQARRVRVVRVLGLATRRGPAPEAQTLYDDLSPPPADIAPAAPPAPGHRRGGRPSRKERQNAARFAARTLE